MKQNRIIIIKKKDPKANSFLWECYLVPDFWTVLLMFSRTASNHSCCSVQIAEVGGFFSFCQTLTVVIAAASRWKHLEDRWTSSDRVAGPAFLAPSIHKARLKQYSNNIPAKSEERIYSFQLGRTTIWRRV